MAFTGRFDNLMPDITAHLLEGLQKEKKKFYQHYNGYMFLEKWCIFST